MVTPAVQGRQVAGVPLLVLGLLPSIIVIPHHVSLIIQHWPIEIYLLILNILALRGDILTLLQISICLWQSHNIQPFQYFLPFWTYLQVFLHFWNHISHKHASHRSYNNYLHRKLLRSTGMMSPVLIKRSSSWPSGLFSSIHLLE